MSLPLASSLNFNLVIGTAETTPMKKSVAFEGVNSAIIWSPLKTSTFSSEVNPLFPT